ncbi:MAG: ParA family protein [Acidobacteriota bacterium]|nr:ParA family protein [Acidobacteriota bacterium]
MICKKGGVGKTTTAVNLAAAIAGIGKRVLLVDLDSQASASLSLGVRREYLAPSLADVLLQARPVRDTIRSTNSLGLDLITGSTDLQTFDQAMGWETNKETRLDAALAPIVHRYDLIIIDCAPNLSLLSVNALVAADNFLVPSIPHYLSIAGVEPLLAAARRLDQRFGTHPELLGVVLTQVDYRTKAARENIAKIRQRWGDDVLAVEIRTNVRLAEAPEHGQTIFEYDRRSTGARAYRLLAAEVLMRARQRTQTEESSKAHKQRGHLEPAEQAFVTGHFPEPEGPPS